MFIELTDILRCPQPHAEQFLVLIPDQMVARSVIVGRLGCPVCQREYPIVDGMADFGGDTPAGDLVSPAVSGEVLATFLGLSGPGGYVAMVGGNAGLGATLIAALPGVHLVGVNLAPDSRELPMLSVVRAPGIPIKSRNLRGVILLEPVASEPKWLREAGRVTLPGLRVVGQGDLPVESTLEVLASAGGWWVAQKT
jgi:uncharacterized protein YbaR (Trm112 family)